MQFYEQLRFSLPVGCCCIIEDEAKTVVVIVGVIELDWFTVPLNDDETTVEFTSEYCKVVEKTTEVAATLVLDSKFTDDDKGGVGDDVEE